MRVLALSMLLLAGAAHAQDAPPEASMTLEQAQARIVELEAALALALQRAQTARAEARNLSLERGRLERNLAQCSQRETRLESDLRAAEHAGDDAERRARSAETRADREQRDRQRAESDARRYRSQARNCR